MKSIIMLSSYFVYKFINFIFRLNNIGKCSSFDDTSLRNPVLCFLTKLKLDEKPLQKQNLLIQSNKSHSETFSTRIESSGFQSFESSNSKKTNVDELNLRQESSSFNTSGSDEDELTLRLEPDSSSTDSIDEESLVTSDVDINSNSRIDLQENPEIQNDLNMVTSSPIKKNPISSESPEKSPLTKRKRKTWCGFVPRKRMKLSDGYG